MFSLFKFLYLIARAFPQLLSIKSNGLAHVPDQSKWLAMTLLSCFWCLAFGLYVGELLTIGYNMVGHIALISMVFITSWVFAYYRNNTRRVLVDYLRMPDRSSRCDEYTDEQRLKLAQGV